MLKVTILDKKDEIHCPYRDVIDKIGNKWSLLILAVLEQQPTRFNELKRTIGDISQKVLTKALRDLEQDGYISRTIHDGKTLKVIYDLTPLGRGALEPIKLLIRWAEQNHALIHQNRKDYVEKQQP